MEKFCKTLKDHEMKTIIYELKKLIINIRAKEQKEFKYTTKNLSLHLKIIMQKQKMTVTYK